LSFPMIFPKYCSKSTSLLRIESHSLNRIRLLCNNSRTMTSERIRTLLFCLFKSALSADLATKTYHWAIRYVGCVCLGSDSISNGFFYRSWCW
jgi:hypothetical protein